MTSTPVTRTNRMRRVARITAFVLGGVLALAALVAVTGAGWLRVRLGRSLPQMEGEARLPGLSSQARVDFDRLGVPTIRAGSRIDAARALGYLHAQNRFFQMDMLRRRASGELAELLGAALLPADRLSRLHQFRGVARRAVADAPAGDRALVEAYTAGVNSGLSALRSAPFEYGLLGSDPRPWLPEDTALAVHAMFMNLNDEEDRFESNRGLMRDLLPGPLVAFLAPAGTEWDAPIVGGPIATPPVPGPEVLDLRRGALALPDNRRDAMLRDPDDTSSVRGSNNWAVAGSVTANGGAMLANDMHLGLSVPNTWYRASLVWPAGEGAREHHVTGVTLPGVPVVVAGSNTHVAWGFTNSFGDWTDLIVLERDAKDPGAYLAPDGPRKIERHDETIHVRGGPDEKVTVESTIWGPILDKDHLGRSRVLKWTAHDPGAVRLGLGMETAATIEEAFEAANRFGIPPQNCVIAESSGRIGWTIMGAIPKRVGFDGSVPESWADGSRRWDGWLDPSQYPRILNPASARVWTANARAVDGEMLKVIGNSGYDLGARARQIRDDLAALANVKPADLLQVQLDDRAVFLERWRDLLLAELTPAAAVGHPRRLELRKTVEAWGGRASIDSVGYRMVRTFRQYLSRAVLRPLTAACLKADARFYAGLQSEGPVWAILAARPPHLLNPTYKSWDDQILAAVDEVLDQFKDGPLSSHPWGERNTVRIEHPVAGGLPFVGRWFSMPREPLPGDSNMPRFQAVSAGASERMVVSPGHEDEGLFHMPAGQCGNPLSPHFGDGHEAWARGKPTPFLPGPTVQTLTLKPER